MRVRPAEKDNDGELTDAVTMVLEKDPLLHAETLSVHTKERVVTLSGAVHSEEQRRMAIYDFWYVPGVHEVHDHMQIRGEPESARRSVAGRGASGVLMKVVIGVLYTLLPEIVVFATAALLAAQVTAFPA